MKTQMQTQMQMILNMIKMMFKLFSKFIMLKDFVINNSNVNLNWNNEM